MLCPNCKAKLDVRDTDSLSKQVLRIRRCRACGTRVETVEEITAVLIPARDADIHDLPK